MNSTNTIGITAATLQHLLIDAGAVYLNYGLAAEALIGATSGGNEFDISPKTRDVKCDGIKGTAKGLTMLTSTAVTLKVNMLEVTATTLEIALTAVVDSTSNPDYDIITGKTTIDLTDYIDNIALVSKISGSGLPIVIILKNAISTTGIKFANKDASDNILPITFTANIDTEQPTLSVYEIRYPKVVNGVTLNLNSVPIVDNAQVVLAFDDIVAPTVPLDGFAVTVNGVADVVTTCTRGINNLNTIALTLTTPPISGQVVTVGYTASDVESASGNLLATFETVTVINN